VAVPTHDARGSQVAFATGEVRTLPIPRRPAPGLDLLRAVVACEHHHGVVPHAQLAEEVEQPAAVAVELEEAVRPLALAAGTLELGTWDHRHVHQRVVEVHEPRLVATRGGPDERFGPPEVLGVTVAVHVKCELGRPR
jgi:hypothetical protein